MMRRRRRLVRAVGGGAWRDLPETATMAVMTAIAAATGVAMMARKRVA